MKRKYRPAFLGKHKLPPEKPKQVKKPKRTKKPKALFSKWFNKVIDEDLQVVYAMTNKRDEMLYVGVCSQYGLRARMSQHYHYSPFAVGIAHIHIMHKADTRTKALDLENQLIMNTKPLYNKNNLTKRKKTPEEIKQEEKAAKAKIQQERREQIIDSIVRGSSCGEVAKEFGITRQRVSGMFKEELGMSIQEFRYFDANDE